MRFINWNISYAGDTESKFKYLQTVITKDTCVMLEEYETHGEEAFVGKGHQRSADAELRKLRKENERLRMENEILKKAAAYFAKHPGDE